MATKAENTAKEQQTAEQKQEAQQTAEQKQEAQQTGQKKDTVRFTLFKDNDKYKGDLFVGVNGKSYLVKRGVEVELPRGVYETIKNSQAQMVAASETMETAAAGVIE